MSRNIDINLGDLLAKALPTDVKVTIRHVSSVPTVSSALFAAAPGEEPEPTFCENHFLSVSIDAAVTAAAGANDESDVATTEEGNGNGSKEGEGGGVGAKGEEKNKADDEINRKKEKEDEEEEEREIIVFGMEVLIYTTSRLTTIFVSKADSTGHLHLLKTPGNKNKNENEKTKSPSLLRRISNKFLSFLVQTHQRPGVRLVVSLFARSQNQYLFPGSIENAGKHVLDDRGLIKWWCRAVDPILQEYEAETSSVDKGLLDRTNESARSSATAFLIVPGCDRFETRGFFPSTARSDNVDKDRPRWVNSYPVHQLCGVSSMSAPPRCLVPRLPDDPKTRFLIDLDDELPEPTEEGEGKIEQSSGQWRSVKSLDQFWEMMAFRQECSAGRLVGFIWLVINPPGILNSVQGVNTRLRSETGDKEEGSSLAKTTKIPHEASIPSKPLSSDLLKGDKLISTAPATNDGSAFSWPQAGRGHVVLSEEDYKEAINFLMEQDFFNEKVSFASTKAWNEKVASLADELWIGQQVIGKNTNSDSTQIAPQPNTLLSVRKRKKEEADQTTREDTEATNAQKRNDQPASDATSSTTGVNVLQANLIRKKKKS